MPSLGLGLGLESSSSQPLGSGSDLTFSPPATLSNVGAYAPLQLTATSASSLPITFEKVSGPCFVENGNLYPTGNGTAVVRAVTSQQTIEGSITLSSISGFSSSVPAVTIYYEGAGQQYNPENDEYYCSNYVGYSMYLNRQNSTTWTDGNAILSFNSTYWRFYTPDNSGCGESEARVTSSNGNIIPTTGWTIITGMSTTPQIDIYKPSLSFTNVPALSLFSDVGQTQSFSGVGLSFSGQAVTLPILITTSGACSLSGTTITNTTPSGETQSAVITLSVLASALYSASSTSRTTYVRSASSLGDIISTTFGPTNANGQRFLQAPNFIVNSPVVSGSWNASNDYLYVFATPSFNRGGINGSSNNLLATPSFQEGSGTPYPFVPNAGNSNSYRKNSNFQNFFFTSISTGLQPSSSLALFVGGINAQNNNFVDGTYLKKTQSGNVYYLARDGSRLESPAYSGSVWRFVKNSTIVNNSSTDNANIPLTGWPSGLGIARATSVYQYPNGVGSANLISVYASGLTRGGVTINRLVMAQQPISIALESNYFSNNAVFPYYRLQANDTASRYEFNSYDINGNPTLWATSATTFSGSNPADGVPLVNWTTAGSTTGDLFIEPA